MEKKLFYALVQVVLLMCNSEAQDNWILISLSYLLEIINMISLSFVNLKKNPSFN